MDAFIKCGVMISVIIPVYNEGDQIGNTIQTIRAGDNANLVSEILVIDGGSKDDTTEIASGLGATVLKSPRKGRAAQLNYGAAQAAGSLLYFLHADTLPPRHFSTDIFEAVKQGFDAGCFRLRFDVPHWFLRTNSWFTRFNVSAFRYGDQSLFITKKTFEKTTGFCERHVVMEDYEFIKRLRGTLRFIILKKSVQTSARKYVANGFYKTQAVFYLIYFMYQAGASQQRLLHTYRRLIRQDKI